MRLFRLLVFFVAMALPMVTVAQKRLYFSLDSAIHHALINNVQLIQSGNNVDKAQEKLKETIANGLPQADATIDYSNFFGAEMEIRFSENAPVSTIPFKPTSNLNVSIGQLIFSGSYLVGVKMSGLYKEMASTNYHKTELDVISQVSQSYYLVLISEELKKIIEKNVANVKELFDKTSLMVSTGILEQTDLDQISTQVASLENSLASSERQVEIALNILRLNLGLDGKTEIQLTDSLDNILKIMILRVR